jgi:two-component system chemotaxis sensor kinase CheA
VTGAELWDAFVARATGDAAQLVAAALDPARLGALGQVAFRIGLSSLLLGADELGRLAIAIEAAIGRRGATGAAPLDPALAAAIATLHDALVQLATADPSGARIDELPLDQRRRALEAEPSTALAAAASPPPGVAAPVADRPSAPSATATGPAFAWTPAVDDDMVELFFDEATERIAALAGKLVEIERRPHDGELIREAFRDLHTIKGSSAMVGLAPVNRLAHAAEDLVGQIRDAGRAIDASVVDALLAALDALRDMLAQARAGAPVTVDAEPPIARLRNPSAGGAAPGPGDAARPSPGEPGAMRVPELPGSPGAAGPSGAPRGRDAAPHGATIRVDFDKLDRLLNLVGELVLGRDSLRGAVHALGAVAGELAVGRGVARRIARLRVAGSAGGGPGQLGDELSRVERVLGDVAGDLDQGTDRLDAISAELREQVMRLRMVSVAGVFRKHVRTVRDLAASLGKRARLELDGEDTELDKLLVEALDEPLLHLVRNAVDHGVEPPGVRTAAGKPGEGVIRIGAAHRGNQVEIRVSDDGRGLDPAALRRTAVERGVVSPAAAEAMDDAAARELIFRAGFSTAAAVSEVSGRGVGMDIVRQAIIHRLKGTIAIESTLGQGSAFVLKLPLTLAIIQVIVARAGGETFAIPLDVVVRVLAASPHEVELIGDREVCVVRGHHVPLVRLAQVLELDRDGDGMLQLVVVDHAGTGHGSYALACDQLLGKREIVIKSLGPLLGNVPCAAGATLLGDRVALILDVPAIIRRALDRPAVRDIPRARRAGAPEASAHILVVEDSDIVRESLRRLLVDAGYQVSVAVDGQHGLELAHSQRFDLISTDVVMPRLDGYDLTRALRALPGYADTPILMVTSMGERIDRVRGFDAGVDDYITKPHDRAQLLRAVRALLGQTGDPEASGRGEDGGA